MVFDGTSRGEGRDAIHAERTTHRFERTRHVRRAVMADLTTECCTIRPAAGADEVLGWSAAELESVSGHDLLHPDDRDALRELAVRSVIGPRRARFVPLVVRMLGRDQRYWWTSWRLVPAGPATVAVGVDYLGPDPSHAAPVGLWRWDVDADTVAWSTDLLDLLGGVSLGPPASYGGFLASVHDDDRADVDRVMRRTLRTGERYVITFRCPSSTQRDRWFHASARRVGGAGEGLAVAGLVRYLNAPRRPLPVIGSG